MVDEYSRLQEELKEKETISDSFNYLSPERKQKFDLLLHLLVNLNQPLLLTGPDGIGKSTFLQCLQEFAPEDWRVCRLECTPQLNFEQIQVALGRFLGMEKDAIIETGQALPRALTNLQRDGRIVVLALDNGGCLIPGVLDAVCRFVSQYSVLRLLAALRPDELHVKAMTDPWAVEQAHVIDLPPLTESQCSAFVRSLWSKSHRSAEPVTEEICQRIYRDSHGVPAKIIKLTQECKGTLPIQWHRAMAKPVYFGLAVLGLAVIGMTWWYQSSTPKMEHSATVSAGGAGETLPLAESASPPVEKQAPAPAENNLPPMAPEAEQPDESPAKQILAPSSVSKKAAEDKTKAKQISLHDPEPETQSSGSAKKQALTGRIQVPAEVPREPAKMVPQGLESPDPALPEKPLEPLAVKLASLGLKDRAWLLAQNPSHYTLQIAAFDQPEDLLKFAKRYAHLGSLAVYRKKRLGKDWYSLVYGVYTDEIEAKQAIKRLPPALGSPWLRRVRAIQKEIRTAMTP